jgi:hypothetical protein
MDWKDSLNVPVSSQGEGTAKRFYGDPKVAAAYLPVAYALLGAVKNRMAYGGVGYGGQQIELPDGTVIRVLRNFEQNIIEITTTGSSVTVRSYGSRIYMESGFIDARSVGFLSEFQEKNKLFETDDTSATNKLLDAQTRGTLPESTLYDEKSHAIPGGYEDKRQLRYVTSMVTGLLRRLVQAKLGVADPTYEVPPIDAPQNAGEQSPINEYTRDELWKLITGGLGRVEFYWDAPHSISGSYGLFAADDYSYHYIAITRTSVYAYPCSIVWGRFFIDAILNGANDWTPSEEEKLRLESYALATLSVDWETKVKIGEHGVIGSSVANGWHFNSRGSKANIIAIERVSGDSGCKHLVSRHYELSISPADYDPEEVMEEGNYPIQSTTELLSEDKGTPDNTNILWIPYYQEAKLVVYYWCQSPRGFSDDIDSSIPVYCFYDHEDTLLVVNVSRERLPDSEPYTVNDVIAEVTSCSGGSVEKTIGGVSRTQGFYVTNGRTYLKTTVVGGTRVKATSEIASTGEIVTGTSLLGRAIPISSKYACPTFTAADFSFPGVDTSIKWTLTGGTITGYIYTSNSFSDSGRGTCIIPFFDTESFYVGKLDYYQDLGYGYTTITTGIGSMDMTWVLRGNPSVVVGKLQASSKATAGGDMAIGGGLPSSRTRTGKVEWDYRNSGELDLYYRHAVKTVASVSYSADYQDINERLEVLGRWTALFAPILFGPSAYPYFDQPYVVVQGMLDNVIYYTDPNSPSYQEGFSQKGIKISDQELHDIYYVGVFSGWT